MAAINAVKIFSGSASNYLAKDIAKYYGKDLGAATILKFSDGEMSPSFDESVRGCDVFIIQSTFPSSDNLMELLLMIDAARRASAHYVTAVMPYFGYSRQDRKDRPRVGIGAKLIGNLLTAAGADRLMTIDLHAGQIQGFMDFPVDHLEGNAIFVPYLKSLNLDNIVFASPSKSRIRNLQSIGRGLRIGENKEKAVLFDISDDFRIGKHTNYTLQHFIERVKIYDDEKFNYKFYNIDLKT